MISRLSKTAKELAACAVALMLLAVSGGMVFNQTVRVRETRDLALPLAATIPPLEKRLSLLTQEVQLAESQSAGTQGSDAERLRVYVLPSDIPLARVVAVIDTLRAALEESKDLKNASGVETGERELFPVGQENLESQTLTFSASVTKKGFSQIFSTLRLSGLLTVSDALTAEERNMLLELLEAGSPADIVALEQFLRTDMSVYGQNPKVYEEKFLSALSSPALSDTFAILLKKSALKDIQEIFQLPLGTKLREQKLLPMPLLRVTELSITPEAEGFQRLTLELQIYGRGE